MIYEKLKKELQVLTEKQNQLQHQLLEMPAGELICTQYGKYTKWYQSNYKSLIYIPKKKRELAETLALKKYMVFQLQEIEKQIIILKRCIKSFEKVEQKSEKLLNEKSPYRELLKKHFEINEKDDFLWEKEEYKRNRSHLETLIYKTMREDMVRSKSEILIANALYMNKIAYRYECELEIKGIHIYPDFTIRRPGTNQICYWEHFGMMENETYRESTYNKLKLYGQAEIIPSVNLITTFETKSCPLDSEKIQKMIEDNLLKK